MTRQHIRKDCLLNVENLTVAYGDKVIINKLNAQIFDVIRPGHKQGQVVALIGPSGVGKTQLFRCIAGLQQPTSGGVTLLTETPASGKTMAPVQAGSVGVVMQHYPLLMHRTVKSNLLLASSDEKKVMDLLTRFKLDSTVNLYPIQLSGGQRQRVAIIQQLLCAEHFMLMDEPFSGLDVVAKDVVINLIHEVAAMDEHNTIIVTTHDIEAAVAVADTVWVMGRLFDANHNSLGATIIDQIDLIEHGLAWNIEQESHPDYHKIISTMKRMFHAL